MGRKLVIELDEEDYEALKQMAIYRGISMQKIVENAVKSYLHRCLAEEEVCEWLRELGEIMGRRPNEIITYLLERYMEVHRAAKEAAREELVQQQQAMK